MTALIAITILWALSFSLIGEYLSGSVDAYAAVAIRMILATLLLLPILIYGHIKRSRPNASRLPLNLMTIGAVQIGLMYLFLYHAFAYLSVAEVLLFTILTPLYITLIDEFIINRKRIPMKWWVAAGLSVLGAAIIRYQQPSSDFMVGFLLIQAANLCFAAGQVAYKRLPIEGTYTQITQYGWFFIGATIVSSIAFALFGDSSKLPSTTTHWIVLLWLGVVASGIGYVAWSIASKKVNIAQLATMNNALIPAGLIVNFLFWESSVNWLALSVGGAIIALSVWLGSHSPKPHS
ncbi:MULTISPECIES: EamA family transporter [Gammaproteobacteria]|uniref:EamA family transporter n=1 Tax=Gammaproteobacteria TaxID=1236 RepID=UPI000DD0239E|nr:MULTISPECIES: EamA family transporter [Gammaproteobacteria]RTE87373.1 EamA family transporter [Aliidiomarina sp. B3213]TCZ92841.1 EamA family transporter [Lysobacter sp. N42]